MKIDWTPTPEPPLLAEDELHVWAVDLAERGGPPDEIAAVLSPDERRRAEQFSHAAARQRYVVTRSALRHLLGGYLECAASVLELTADQHGKPRLGGGLGRENIRFNVAHCDGAALIAVARGCEVGVDVECMRSVNQSLHIARRYFHPNEATAISLASPAMRDAAFLRCWTSKEAVLKAMGRGITGSLANICTPTDAFQSTWIDVPGGPRCWLHSLALAEQYVAAVACVGSSRVVRCYGYP